MKKDAQEYRRGRERAEFKQNLSQGNAQLNNRSQFKLLWIFFFSLTSYFPRLPFPVYPKFASFPAAL